MRLRTGKGWDEWFALLDEWGARDKGHRKTARYLLDQHGTAPWWSQAIAIRYEWDRGLRK
ncbi:MAG: hypothetical protein HYX92_08615 [Chloroflexi bacterium]|nr:hypothetical protein [Chloroflexota bacterium]